MPKSKQAYDRPVYIVDSSRTPFLKARTKPNPFSASDLAVFAGRDVLLRQPFDPKDLGEVVVGSVMPSSKEANIARVISLRLGCGKTVPAWTVQRNCASGLQALDSAAQDIGNGRYELVLAGGTESMSQAPLLFNREATTWFAAWFNAKSWTQKLRLIFQLRPQFFMPVFALLNGLTDHVVNLSMGQTAENLAYRFNITRKEMDEFAVLSHQHLIQAQENNLLARIVPVYDASNHCYTLDDGVRADSSVEKLATLKPNFDKKFGEVTAGNSSQITDGAAMLLLASEEAVKKYQLPVLGRIVDTAWAGCDPAEMGLGPAYASAQLLTKQKLSLSDIDYWEINEAFAGQVIACLKALDNADFCKEEVGLKDKLGMIDSHKLNIHGGAIAIGHPVGASGARLVHELLHILKIKKAKRGIATLCIGGGQGGAMLIENVDSSTGEA